MKNVLTEQEIGELQGSIFGNIVEAAEGDPGHVLAHNHIADIINNIGYYPAGSVQKTGENSWADISILNGPEAQLLEIQRDDAYIDSKIAELNDTTSFQVELWTVPNNWTTAQNASIGDTLQIIIRGPYGLVMILGALNGRITALESKIPQ